MKLETKKTLAKLILKLIHPFYKKGLRFKHNGKNHYVLRAGKLKLKSKFKIN